MVEEVYEDALRPAHHLFDLPELVGRILSHVSLCDLRRAREVNQLFRNVVDGSPYLQQAMFLRSDPKSDFASVLESTEYCKHCRLPWFNLYYCSDCTRMFAILKVESKPRRPGFRSLRVTNTYGGSEEAAKKLTPRTRSLLAFQPPVRTVEISTSCCNDPLHRGLAKSLTLESVVQANTILLPEVLTIGVLVDLTLSFKKQHSSCSTAEPCTVGVSAHVFLQNDHSLATGFMPECVRRGVQWYDPSACWRDHGRSQQHGDVLDNFDFDSFLNTGYAGRGFDLLDDTSSDPDVFYDEEHDTPADG